MPSTNPLLLLQTQLLNQRPALVWEWWSLLRPLWPDITPKRTGGPPIHLTSKLSQRSTSAVHTSLRVNTPRQYVLYLPARMHLERYMKSTSFPTVILSASIPANKKPKQHVRSAPFPPFKPFASMQLPPQQTNISRLPLCTSCFPTGHRGRNNLLTHWNTVCTPSLGRVERWGNMGVEKRRSCGWPSSVARGSQVAGDGRLVWLLAKQ